MPSYTQTRYELTTGVYAPVDAVNGSAATITSVVQSSFPSYTFTVSGTGSSLYFDFNETLTSGEQTTLANLVSGFTPITTGTGYSDMTSTGLAGDNLNLIASSGYGGSTYGGAGGNVNITAGNGGGDSSSMSGAGGNVTITGGTGGNAGTYGTGGNITLTAGTTGGSTGTGGTITFEGGVGGSSGSGGALIFKTAATTTLAERMRITKDGYVQIADYTMPPSNPFNVGSSNAFSVSSSGDLVKLKGLTYSWPSSHNTSGYALTNNGSGTLTWSAVGSVTGSATANQVAYWSGMGTAISGESNFWWDSSNDRLGIGTSSPGTSLNIQQTTAKLRFGPSSTQYIDLGSDSSGNCTLETVNSSGTPGSLTLKTNNSSMGAASGVTISAGNSGMMSAGPAVTINAGNGGSSGAAGGAINITAGTGGGSSAGGGLNLVAGTGGSSNGAGADVTIKGGVGAGSGAGGAIILQTATTTSLTDRVKVDKDGKVGIGTSSAGARVEIETTSTEATSALLIDQNDTDQPFITFEGQSSANATDSISTNVIPGTIQGWLQININGTKRWIPFYNDPT